MALTVAGLLCLAGCDASADDPAADGNPAQGAKLIAQFGCGSCHIIPGIGGADGVVGPPLEHIGEQTIIAGVLPNTPEHAGLAQGATSDRSRQRDAKHGVD